MQLQLPWVLAIVPLCGLTPSSSCAQHVVRDLGPDGRLGGDACQRSPADGRRLGHQVWPRRLVRHRERLLQHDNGRVLSSALCGVPGAEQLKTISTRLQPHSAAAALAAVSGAPRTCDVRALQRVQGLHADDEVARNLRGGNKTHSQPWPGQHARVMTAGRRACCPFLLSARIASSAWP